MALPNFLIIGAAKAGTTSLHHYLDQHPQIQMAAIKETNFFAGPPRGLPYPFGRVDRLDRYEQLFDPAYEARGEASPSYTNAPRRSGVPERIKALLPEVRFIYLVRDPVARTFSHYRMLVAAGKERRELRDALHDLSRVDPRAFNLTSQGFYAYQLERYLARFPEERILVLDQSELLDKRDDALRSVFSFLAVDDSFTCEGFDAELFKGSERRVYPPLVTRFVKPVLAPAARRLPAGLRGSISRSLGRSLPPLPSAELDDESRARLQQLYAPDVARLRALTGKAFPGWNV